MVNKGKSSGPKEAKKKDKKKLTFKKMKSNVSRKCAMNVKVSDLVREVYNNPTTNEANVSSMFMKKMVNTLLGLTDEMSYAKNMIHIILKNLIDIAVNYVEKTDDFLANSSDRKSQPIDSVREQVKLSTDSQPPVQALIDIDQQMLELMKQKQSLYHSVFSVDGDNNTTDANPIHSIFEHSPQLSETIATDEVTPRISHSSGTPWPNTGIPFNSIEERTERIIAIKEEILYAINSDAKPMGEQIDDLLIPLSTSSPSNVDSTIPRNDFSLSDKSDNVTHCNESFVKSDTGESSRETISRRIPQKRTRPESPNELCQDITSPSEPDVVENISQSTIPNSVMPGPCKDESLDTEPQEIDRNDENLYTCLKLPSLTTNVLIIQVFRQTLFAGCDDGSLIMFNMKTGEVVDNIMPHCLPFTCLLVVKDKVITGSLDGLMKCYNVSTRTLQTINLKEPLTCCDTKNEMIYVGTAAGHIRRVCTRYLITSGASLQISNRKVKNLKVFPKSPIDVIAVSIEGDNKISVRDARTGAILKWIFSSMECNFLEVSADGKVYYDQNKSLIIYDLTTAKKRNIKNGYVVALITIHQNFILVAGRSRRLIFYNKSFHRVFTYFLPPGNPLSMCVHSKKIFISTSSNVLAVFNFPNELR